MIIQCQVKSVQPLATHTYQILLQPEHAVAYQAGQYLMVVMGLLKFFHDLVGKGAVIRRTNMQFSPNICVC